MLVRLRSTVRGFLVILRPIVPDSVQACGYSGRCLPDPSSYSVSCLVQQQMRFTRQRFLYAALMFPSRGELSKHEVLFYMVCPTFSSHSLRYWYCIEMAIISKISFCRWISSRQQRQPPSYRPCLRGMDIDIAWSIALPWKVTIEESFGLTSLSLQSSTRPFAG